MEAGAGNPTKAPMAETKTLDEVLQRLETSGASEARYVAELLGDVKDSFEYDGDPPEETLDALRGSLVELIGWAQSAIRDLTGEPLPAVDPEMLPTAKAVTLIRRRPWETPGVWADAFLYSGTEPAEASLRSAVVAFVATEDGKQAIQNASCDFNWGDAVMHVPDAIWAAHGIVFLGGHNAVPAMMVGDGITIRVDQDEILCGPIEEDE